VLFICVKNGGKSQMAAGLMRQIAGQRVMVHSAGTKPGAAINELSAQALLEVGVDITDETSDANNIGLYCFSSPRRSPVCEET
jgi:arsenate-mycothiol transferase